MHAIISIIRLAMPKVMLMMEWWRVGGYGEGGIPSDPICLQETSPNQSPTKLSASRHLLDI